MRKPHPLYRPVFAAAVALAMTTLVACNKAETPMDAPAAPPASTAPMAPAEAPSAMTAPPATTTDPAAPPTTVGEKIDDTVITTKVKAALLADEAVKGTEISVTTVAGEVQLSGAVANQAQIDRAVEVAKGVQGVARVQNGVTLKQ